MYVCRHFTSIFVINRIVYLNCFPVPILCTELGWFSWFLIHLRLQWHDVSSLSSGYNFVHGMLISHPVLFFRCPVHFDWLYATIPTTECASRLVFCYKCAHARRMIVVNSYPPLSSMALCILIIFLFQFRVWKCRCLSLFHSHLSF